MDVKRFLGNLYVLPYIGGVVAIGALFFPAAANFTPHWTINSFTFWVWGLVCTIDWKLPGEGWIWDNYFYMISDPLILILGIILSILIVFFGVKMVLRARKIAKEDKFLDKTFVLYGGLLLVFISIWVVIVQIFYSITGYFPEYFQSLDPPVPFSQFWSYFEMNFGVIGVYLGGSLPIIGYVIHVLEYKRFDYLFFDDDKEIQT